MQRQTHVAVVEAERVRQDVGAAAHQLRPGHADAGIVEPERVAADAERSRQIRHLGGRWTEGQGGHARARDLDDHRRAVGIGHADAGELAVDVAELHHALVARRNAIHAEARLARERRRDRAVARGRRRVRRLPLRAHHHVAVHERHVGQADPVAESGKRVARLRRVAGEDALPVPLVVALIEDDHRIHQPHVGERDPLADEIADVVAHRRRVGAQEGRAEAVGDGEIGDRGAMEQVPGDPADAHLSVGRVLDGLLGEAAHALAAPVRVRDQDDGEQGDDERAEDDAEQDLERAPHQYACPIERWSVRRLRICLIPPPPSTGS